MSIAAVILAGGRGRRLGVPKPDVSVNSRTLLQRTLDAVRPRPGVVVGPPGLARAVRDDHDVTLVCEDPPFGGPAAAIAAALIELDRRRVVAEHALLLPCDLVHPMRVVTELLREPAGGSGTVLHDDHDRPQWLCSIFPIADLRAAGARARPGMSVRELLASLPRGDRRVSSAITADIDTPADLAAARGGLP